VVPVLLVVVGKTSGCYCSCWAPDDGCEDAWNVL